MFRLAERDERDRARGDLLERVPHVISRWALAPVVVGNAKRSLDGVTGASAQSANFGRGPCGLEGDLLERGSHVISRWALVSVVVGNAKRSIDGNRG